MRESLCLVFVALLLVAPASAQERREVPEFRTYGEPERSADAVAIDALIREYRRSWALWDTDALMKLHADNVEWINAYARVFQGAAPLADFLEHRLFPEFDPAVSEEEAANMKTVSIRYFASHAAIIHMYTEGRRGSSRNPGEDVRRIHIHLILERQDSGWKVVHTAIMDAR